MEIIKKVLKGIISEVLDLDSADMFDNDSLSNLGADSLDVMEIELRVEKYFGIKINDFELFDIEDYEPDITIEEMARYIKLKLSKE